MLRFELRADEAMLILRPQGALEASDFKSLATVVDAYLGGGGRLHGVLISAKSFPGWENLDGLIAHFQFVRRHHSCVEKIAVVADGLVATLLPKIGSHFVHAKLQHFVDDATAMSWLAIRAPAPAP